MSVLRKFFLGELYGPKAFFSSVVLFSIKNLIFEQGSNLQVLIEILVGPKWPSQVSLTGARLIPNVLFIRIRLLGLTPCAFLNSSFENLNLEPFKRWAHAFPLDFGGMLLLLVNCAREKLKKFSQTGNFFPLMKLFFCMHHHILFQLASYIVLLTVVLCSYCSLLVKSNQSLSCFPSNEITF